MDAYIVAPPGSDVALKLGCRCPVIDNCHGEGFPYGDATAWYVNPNCDLHGDNAAAKEGK